MTTRIKICCIASEREAALAAGYGAAALGLVGRMPSGPGPIDDPLIALIAKTVPPPIATFLLTCETRADDIIAHHSRTLTNTLQLVDEPEISTYRKIRDELPFIKLVQVIHVTGEHSLEQALKVSEHVDAILLDSGNPNLEIKELGGTGRVHDWAISRKIRDQVKVPVFLAGGLNAGNVKRAIEAVEPFAVDVCSGVRTNGLLDEKKLDEFFRAAMK
jgi:phosphoribosylanthranilate isomerase